MKTQTQRRPMLLAEFHQFVQRLGKARESRGVRRSFEESLRLDSRNVEDLVADGDADARSLISAAFPEEPERQVLKRKVAAGLIGGLHPRRYLWVMSLVEFVSHKRSIACR